MLFPKGLPMPNAMEKSEILSLLLKEEYGVLPMPPNAVVAKTENIDQTFCAGKAVLKTILITCKLPSGDFAFPVYFACPHSTALVPCFIHINFKRCIPDRYQPTEELIDAGYATLTFCYEDITADNANFTDKLAGLVYPGGEKTADQCGKIGLWAWAASRVMDYALTLSELDSSKISLVGHSRLGKTALLAGALDERFYCVFSNNSGCSGAALARNKTGETIKQIIDQFPFWFCENYQKYADNEDKLPFDQHFLIAANMPHKVYISSAIDDLWACPPNEYLSCVAATTYYERHGLKGLVHRKQRVPAVGDLFHEGNIAYHLRRGCHYLSREDWGNYIRFLNAK